MLSNVKILDLSRVLAGPLCTMTLGDLGADIIKVERPGKGDDTRSWGPPFDDRGESAYYLSINRNKKSIALDLRSEQDRAVIRRLAEEADVVVDNYLPGTLEKFGIDASALLATHTRLVWCTITGFGQKSPRAGYDLVVQAESGWMAITGEPDGDPMKIGVALADVIAGKDATIAILAALAARSVRQLSLAERHIYISLSTSATAALVNVAQNALVTGKDAKRWGNQHPNLVPYQLFHAADRAVILAVGNDSQWQSACRALSLGHLASDESLSTNEGRLANRNRLVAALAERFLQRNASEWTELLRKEGVPCGVVKSVLEAVGAVESSPLTGIVPSVPGSVRLPPPRLDEHGSEIRELGWNAFAR
jgi:crotonobetainyl-CoA:carnitine CoA-transferase CaiB-like acyl-CoA transferase